MSTARIFTCPNVLLDIIIISKFCCDVHGDNVLFPLRTRTLYTKYNVRVNLAEILLQTACSVHLDIIIISKFCGSVHSENFIVSTYHFLNLSSGRNHFFLSVANQAKKVPAKHGTSAFRGKCRQSTSVLLEHSGQTLK